MAYFGRDNTRQMMIATAAAASISITILAVCMEYPLIL